MVGVGDDEDEDGKTVSIGNGQRNEECKRTRAEAKARWLWVIGSGILTSTAIKIWIVYAHRWGIWPVPLSWIGSGILVSITIAAWLSWDHRARLRSFVRRRIRWLLLIGMGILAVAGVLGYAIWEITHPAWLRIADECNFAERVHEGENRITRVLPQGFWDINIYSGDARVGDRIDFSARCSVDMEGEPLSQFDLQKGKEYGCPSARFYAPRMGRVEFLVEMDVEDENATRWLDVGYLKQEDYRKYWSMVAEVFMLAGLVSIAVGAIGLAVAEARESGNAKRRIEGG